MELNEQRQGSGTAASSAEAVALTPELYERLRPHLLESVAVVSAEGRVRAMLGPPGGALGIGEVVGRHIFEYCLEQDVPRAMELAVEALHSSPGWSTTWVTRLAKGTGESADFEIHIENHQDDPLVDGFILRLRELPAIANVEAPVFATELGTELERLAGAVPLPILFIGSNGYLYFSNEAARVLCRGFEEALRSDGLAALAAPADASAVQVAVEEMLSAPGERVIVFEMAGTSPPRMIEARLSGLGSGDRVLALVATLVDVTDRLAIEAELRRRASSDSLTGLINREELEAILANRLERRATDVTLLFADLDGFKGLNDTMGHAAGDECLVEVARILSTNVRTGDVVARVGGDEFVVVLDRAATGIGGLIERVEQQIDAYAAQRGASVGVSIGWTAAQPGDSVAEALGRADRAMYYVKRSKRASE